MAKNHFSYFFRKFIEGPRKKLCEINNFSWLQPIMLDFGC